MTHPHESSHPMQPLPTPPRVRLLWATVMAAPVVVLGDLQAGYTLALFACSRQMRYLPLLSTVVALLVVTGAVAYARGFGGEGRARLRGQAPADAEPSTNGWVAMVAIGLNLMAVVLVLAMAIPRLVLEPCWR